MNIVKRVKETKLNDKKLIYVFLLLSFVFCVGEFLSDVLYYVQYNYRYNIDWLQIIRVVSICLFCVYFIFFFDNFKTKKICFIVALTISAIEPLILVIKYLIHFDAIDKIFIPINLVLLFCYIALIMLAFMGIRNKVLFFVFSIICCIAQYSIDRYYFSLIFLNVAILIFGLNNYLPTAINNSDYNFKNKTNKEKLIILKEQFDGGMISEEEYKQQRQNIIDNF